MADLPGLRNGKTVVPTFSSVAVNGVHIKDVASHGSSLQSRPSRRHEPQIDTNARSCFAPAEGRELTEPDVSSPSGNRAAELIREELDVLFFSRGRGKGHAVPDLSIIAELRKICPGVRIAFASYATGAEVFEAAGERLLRMDLPENNPFANTVVCAAKIMNHVSAPLVVSHEDVAVLPAAKIFESRTVFLTHWFSAPQDPYLHSLRFADEVLFMERAGLFPEPDVVAGRVHYLGPVLRRFHHFPADRTRVREELGLNRDDVLILMLPGNPSEELAPTCELVLGAFGLIKRPNKRLIWVAGKDHATVLQAAGNAIGVQVIDVDWKLDRLMVASDAAITKGTYNIGRELNALGIPSIVLSYGQNFIDDLYARSFSNTTFLWAKEANPATLASHIEVAFNRGIAAPNFSLLNRAGAAAVASRLLENLERTRHPKSHSDK